MCSFRGPSDVFARLCTIKRVPLCRCSSYTLPCTWWYAVGFERLRCGLGLHPTRELSGKNAVNRGAGYETSLRLAKEGAPVVLATVVLAGRSLAKLADAPDGSCARTRSAASVKSVEGKSSVVAYRRPPRPASVSGSSSSVSRRLSGSSSNNPQERVVALAWCNAAVHAARSAGAARAGRRHRARAFCTEWKVPPERRDGG